MVLSCPSSPRIPCCPRGSASLQIQGQDLADTYALRYSHRVNGTAQMSKVTQVLGRLEEQDMKQQQFECRSMKQASENFSEPLRFRHAKIHETQGRCALVRKSCWPQDKKAPITSDLPLMFSMQSCTGSRVTSHKIINEQGGRTQLGTIQHCLNNAGFQPAGAVARPFVQLPPCRLKQLVGLLSACRNSDLVCLTWTCSKTDF